MSSSGLTQNRCVLCLSLPAAQSGAHSQTARAEKVRLHARCVVSKRETRQRLQRTSHVVPKSVMQPGRGRAAASAQPDLVLIGHITASRFSVSSLLAACRTGNRT